MLRRSLLITTMLLGLVAGYVLFTDDGRVVPYRNTAQYWALRWFGMFPSATSAARGTLHGTVRTPLGPPDPQRYGAGAQIDGTAWSAETDAAGRYTLAVPPGSYVAVAGAPGYDDAAIHTLLGIGVTANAQTRLDITLHHASARRAAAAQCADRRAASVHDRKATAGYGDQTRDQVHGWRAAESANIVLHA
jgi:hypothetical protein